MLSFSHEMSWMRSWAYLSQFLWVFLDVPTLVHVSTLRTERTRKFCSLVSVFGWSLFKVTAAVSCRVLPKSNLDHNWEASKALKCVYGISKLLAGETVKMKTHTSVARNCHYSHIPSYIYIILHHNLTLFRNS